MKFPILAGLLAFSPFALADQRGDQPDAPPSTPQEQLAKFHVPPGFEVQLVAAEPEIPKPINLNFDSAGRLWATGSELYPWAAATDVNELPIPGFAKVYQDSADFFAKGKAPPPSLTGKDTVRILSDFGPDGHARKIETFADGLNIPTGIQPLPRQAGAKGDTAIVYSIPNIWRFEDTDGDGRADKKEPLYEGFEFVDTHGMSSNYVYWIDGWIYGCHGFKNHSEVRDRAGRVTVFDSGNTYRFRPDGSAIEYWSHGQTNPFGLAFDELGNLYSADSHSKPVYLLLRGGYYEGIGKQHDGLGFAPRITDDDHGSSAIAGIAYYADDKWPEEYRGNLFNGNPVTRRINRDRLEWHGSTPKAIRMPDFLTCDDPWFRPVQVKLGPDGALWIADFYNPIIGHYEVPLTDPRRDHTHGRIWRVVYRGERKDASITAEAASGRVGVPLAVAGILPDAGTPLSGSAPEQRSNASGRMPETAGRMPTLPMPDLSQLDAAGLVEKLRDPNLIVRTLATHELVERVGEDAAKPLDRTLEPLHPGQWILTREAQRAHALWALERLGALERLRIARAGEDAPSVRLQSLRILSERKGNIEFDVVPADITDNLFLPVFREGERAAYGCLSVVSAGLQGRHFPREAIFRLLNPKIPEADTHLTYAIRLALRDQLASTAGYTRIAELDPEGSERLADVSIAINTTEAAEFLISHLRRTKLATPRAGEYLSHAALHLPAEKFDEVVALVQQLGDAPLTQKFAVVEGLSKAARKRALKLPEEIAIWSHGVLIEALGSADGSLVERAIATVRDEKIPEKFEPLRSIATKAAEPFSRRVSALEALANLPESGSVFVTVLNDPSSLSARKKAAELLAQQDGKDSPSAAPAREALLAAIPAAPTELATTIATGLVKTDAGAGQLLDLVETRKVSATLLRAKSVASALASRERGLQDRATALTTDLPAEDARLDAVIAARVEAFRSAKPNAAHGAEVFAQNCAVCHRFQNAGGNVGPNLDGIATRGAHRLIQDILDPSRNADPAFRQTMIETNDGRMVAGANLREQPDSVTLADVTGKDIVIATADIKTRTASKLSLMPPAFENQITPTDFQDLLAYLLGPAEAPPR